ncbi:MAG: AAA family ATPase, partial [Candidatus Bipolaricaulota bacterium]
MAYSCGSCGYRSIKWLGRCPSCGEWDSFAQQVSTKAKKDSTSSWIGETLCPINEIDLGEVKRLKCGIGEVDRILGGGLIPGAVILFGGEPGIGKSTLLLQLAQSVARENGNVLYISGEESAAQIKLRADRLGVEDKHLYVLSEQSLSRIIAAIKQVDPCVLIVDSIQATVS